MNDWQTSLAEGVAGLLGDLVKAGNERLEPDAAIQPKETDDGRVFGAAARAPEALMFDPYAWYSGAAEYHTRRISLGWGHMRNMAASPPISAIVKRRCEDGTNYSEPEENPYLAGYQIRMRNRKASPSRAATRMIDELTRFVQQCGVVTDMRQTLVRDDFSTFLKKVIRDSLVYDQLCFEVVPSKLAKATGGHRPAMFVASPAHSMRIAITDKDGHGLPEDDYQTPRYVQVYDEVVVNEFTPSEMCFAVRNPRSDLDVAGYGYSELEMMVTILTAWLNAFDRNHKFFTQGVGIPGILNLKGSAVNEKIMRAFKRELQMLVAGVGNSHRLPVTSAEGLEFVNLGSTNKDMEYAQWIDMLTKLACALYSMDPAEIGFNFGNTGQNSSMGTANQVEKIAESRDRGLRPLIKFIFAQLNRYVIWQLDPDFELVAQGLRQNSEKEDLDLDKERAATYMTVDQIRALRDQPPMEDGKGKVILNPTWLQFSQAMDAQKQQGGQEDGSGDGAPPDMGGMFDPPQNAQQDQPGEDGEQQQENDDTSGGTVKPPMIQPQSQPLAASMSARRPRVSSFTL